MGGEWHEQTLESLIDPDSSVTYGVVKPGPKDAQGVNFIRGGDIVGGQILVDQLRTITTEVSEQYKRTQLKGGEIIVSLVGNPGQVAIVPASLAGANIARQVGLLRLRDDADKDYVKYYLMSPKGQRSLLGYSLGSVQQVINLKDLKRVTVPIPPLSKQKAIAHILGTLDDKIELNRRMNTTLEAMAQALFKSWFVDFDPVIDKALAAGNPIPEAMQKRAEARRALGDRRKPLHSAIAQHFPSRFIFSEEMGWVPEGWEVATIGDFCEVIDCLHSKKPSEVVEDTGNVMLQLNNICDNGLLNLHKKYFISETDYEKWISRIEVSEGDCVITNVGRVGAVSIIPKGVKAAMGRNMTAVRLQKHHDLKAFLITLLNSQHMALEIRYRTDVGTILNALNVKSIPMLRFLNARRLLYEFEIQVRPMLSKRQDLVDENMNLSNLRDTLLPKLLSGQLRIPDAEKLI